MEIYIICLISLIVGGMLDIFQCKTRNLFFILNFTFLFLVATFRFKIGADYFQYVNLFSDSQEISDVSLDYFLTNPHSIEYGYLILESFIKYFTNDYDVFIFIYNFIMFFFLYKGIKYFPNHNIQLFIFYCLLFLQYTIDAYRQGMALSISLFSIRYLFQEKFIKYILCIFLAFLFHKVSILLIPLYFIIKVNFFIKKYTILVILFISILLSYFGLIGKIIEFMFLHFDSNSLVSRVYFYYFIKHDSNLSIGFLAYFHRALFLLIICFFISKIDNRLTFLVLLSSIIFFTFSHVGVLAGRFSAMFYMFYMVYFSILFSKSFNHKIATLVVIMLYFSSIFFKDLHIVIHPTENDEYRYIPYQTIIFDR